MKKTFYLKPRENIKFADKTLKPGNTGKITRDNFVQIGLDWFYIDNENNLIPVYEAFERIEVIK